MQRTIISLVALVALALPATAAAAGPGSSAQKHQLSMYKVEKPVEIDAADYAEDIELKCEKGDLALDGMWRVDDVQWNFQLHDEGPFGPYNRYNGVDVFNAFSSGKGSYTFAARNNSEETAQMKFWITCLGNPTEPGEGDGHKHTFDLSELHEHTVNLAGGTVTTLRAGNKTCAAGELVVAPGFWVANGGTLKLYRSWPEHGGHLNAWELGFYAPEDPDVTTSVRCLKVRTNTAGAKNHRHHLKFKLREHNMSMSKNFSHVPKQDCGEHEKALIGAFDIKRTYAWGAGYDAHWLWYLGMEPQIKSRVFHVQNTSQTHSLTGRFGAICFNDRTKNRSY